MWKEFISDGYIDIAMEREKKQQQQNLPKKVTVCAFIFRTNKLTLKGLFRM